MRQNTKIFAIGLCISIAHSQLLPNNQGNHVAIDPELSGLGFFEGSTFTGIWGASLAGGTEILYIGQGMSHYPSDFTPTFTSKDFYTDFYGSSLSQDNAFNSHTDYGKLQYTTPSAMDLLSVDWEDLLGYDTLTFQSYLIDVDSTSGYTKTQECSTASYCYYVMSRYYTPILYYLSPPLVYYGSELTFVVDPKSAQNYKGSLDWPFTEARISNQVIDFEGQVSELTTLSTYTKNYIRGTAGHLQPVASADVKFKFKAGYAQHFDDTMIHCSFDNSTCYKAKVLAVINDISASSGYTTGGQNLTITGYGFNSPNIVATVDGVSCTVSSYTQTSFSCSTGAQSSPSTNTNYVGQHGLRRKLFNQTTTFSIASMLAISNYTESLALQFEAQVNLRDGAYGNVYSGYFKAPATANYRFYTTCDDRCDLYLGSADKDPSTATLIYSSSSWSSYRKYFTPDNDRLSSWVPLTKDSYYFIEARHVQWSGGDHMTVSVEIDQATSGHHHAMREVQRLQINPTNVREQSKITITNPDGGTYYLNIQSNDGSTIVSTDTISTTATASQVQSALSSYYSTYCGATISVTLTMYDSSGNEVTDTSLRYQNVYIITVNRALSKASTTYASPKAVTTTSSIAYTKPSSLQLSSKPLSGSFTITCQNTDGTSNTTDGITSSASTYTIGVAIATACSMYKGKIDIWEGPTYSYTDDGRDIMIRFTGVNQDIPQFSIQDYTTTPLVGNSITFNSTTMVAYGSSLFYEPIPFEFLYTNETSPQVIVTVDGIEAVCESLSCNYNYFAQTSSITGFSLSGTTLTIDGVNLPTTDLQSIYFSNVACTATSKSSSQIICTLSSSAVAGTWQPVVTDSNGLIAVSTSTTEQIQFTISSVSPTTGLNAQGDTEITITGTNFPPISNDGNSVSITFSDGTACSITSLSSTTIKCKTSDFSSRRILTSSTLTMTVNINAMTNSAQSVTVTSAPATISAISPSYASPVLKTTLVLTVTGFSGTLSPDDLSVTLVSTTNSSYTKAVNVIEVGNTVGSQYITVKYGGAYSGTYNVYVTSATYGKFDSSSILLTAIGAVTGFSPSSGSVYGGTLITITGYNFSTDITDNPVKIGNTYCDVITSTNDEITCRTNERDYIAEVSDDFIVFLKTSEEAVCNVASACTYSWIKTGLPNLSSYSVSYDSSLGDYVITLSGSGFPTSTSDVTFQIDGYDQTVISSTSTEIKVQIINMDSQSSTDINFYLPTGTPEGASTLTSTGITLPYSFLSLSPQTGSPAGTLITASVKGVGINTSGATLTTSSGTDICSTVTISSFGILYCQTKALTVSSSTLKFKIGTTSTSCSGTSCTYATSTSMPSVTSVSIYSDNMSMTFTGTNLDLSGFSAAVTYANIAADSVSVSSSTSVLASWSYGVPLSATAVSPVLYYKSSTSNETHWASISTTLSNTVTTTSISTSVSCSFAGGCTLSINQVGLLSALSSDLNNITVCGYECEYDSSASTYAQVQCSIPAVPTTYSVENYQIVTESYLTGTPFSSNTDYTFNPFDGNHQNGFYDTKAGCYFGTAFKSGYVGVLNEVKFYMNQFKKTNYVGLLSFQVSTEGTTWTTLFTVGEEIHEGWNYYDYSDSNLKYRYYRFYGSAASACTVGEIGLRGYEAIDDDSTFYTCAASINLNGNSVSLTGSIIYQDSLTPKLTSISPRFGTVKGGESVTFTGTNFITDTSKYTINIDGQTCSVTAATSTSVTCTTASRPGTYDSDPTLEFSISGYGNVATQQQVFRYVNYWSDEDTWGGEFLPMEGESIWIPTGLHLLVDIDETPILNAILVEGSLIFAPDSDSTHERTFDARYIFVKGGYLEIGTEDYPYTSQLTITMHGTKEDPELPIYGNKVIGVRQGVLDMHGVTRTPTWTELSTTANAGDTTITLNTAVDWQVGEKIVIAPTGYDNLETEEKTILAIANPTSSTPVITLDSPLLYKHYAGKQTFGSDYIEMRAEVGLLTRNVKYRGDPETSSLNSYGAHIMLHSAGDESLIGRIEYCEFEDVGQAFQLGRYPLHFHMIGTVHYSYIRGNSIHNTYNRAVTFHGVHYLRVMYNVAYKTMGHTFFIEDAVETKNYIVGNLALLNQRSFSLLNTDTTPASFWITHPDNIFTDNHAGGADRYGYWFDTKEHSTGPSYDVNVCPENTQLGEFSNNVAHSNGRYGLRIFHKLIPRQYPCNSLIYDSTNTTDPYWQNPLITAEFINYTGWKNQENGIIFEQVGDVRIVDAKVADNMIAGIEYSLTKDTADGTAQISSALVIGYSENADQITLDAGMRGVITARTENFQVHNVKFYNLDNNDQSAGFGTCSHCFHPAATDSGARQITTSGLYFDSTVPKRIIYQYPYRDIFYDTDSSLTGFGSGSWATFYWEHNFQPECQRNEYVYNGLLCGNSIQIRRVVLYGYSPSIFESMEIKILKYDDYIQTALAGVDWTYYVGNETNYSVIPFKPKQDPMNAWAVPYVTGHKYKIHWRYGLDFTTMKLDLSTQWQTTDSNLYFIFNHTDVRQKVEVITGGVTVDNATLLTKSNSDWQTGDNVVYNDTSVREIHLLLNGKNIAERSTVTMNGYRCVGSCLTAINDSAIENTTRLWSNASSWDNGTVPVAGESVEVQSGWNMIYDLEESPIYEYIEINGRLTFLNGANLELKTKYLFVRAGELIIGTEEEPFSGTANITLYGEKANKEIVYANAIEAGNKIIANTNKIRMYGSPRVNKMARLLKDVYPGDTSILVDAGLDWVAGDRIGLAPTSFNHVAADYAVISGYDSTTGVVTLDRQMTYYHYGSKTSTQSLYDGIDIRGEVMLFSRNIIISGEDYDAWGCQIVTSDFIEEDLKYRNGNTVMDNVEIYNCSQYDTEKAAIRFEGAKKSWSMVSNSSIHHGLGWGVQISDSANVILKNNSIFDFKRIGINIETESSNITLDGNIVSKITEREVTSMDGSTEPGGGILACALVDGDPCSDLSLKNNIVAGAAYTCYSVPAHGCDVSSSDIFYNNIAHSTDKTGAIMFLNPWLSGQSTCVKASHFTAYKCTEDGAIFYQATKEARFANMNFIDNGYAGTLMIGQEGDSLKTTMSKIKIYGEAESKDCTKKNGGGGPNRGGLLLPYFSFGGKPNLVKMKSALPYHKIKTDGSYGGYSYYDGIQFLYFKNTTTYCGQSQYTFSINPAAADYIPRVQFRNTNFTEVHQDAMGYFMSPPWSWANLDDCGNYPCTAPNNILLQFEKTTFTGTLQPALTASEFQIVANNAGNTDKFPGCNVVKNWNAVYCKSEYLGVLLFESLDDDKWKRTVTPIKITNYDYGSENIINTYMDHIWDGFYTGQLRLSRFPSVITTKPGVKFNISYAGTPPSNQRFTLNSDLGGVTLRIKYTKTGAYILTDSTGKTYQANAWDDSTKQPGAIKQTQCGENRYIGVENILEFYIKTGCTVYVKSIDSIQSSIRLNWTLSEFYADGGSTKFIDRMAASLGIHASNIKVVSVYQGSVIVGFSITETSRTITGGLTTLKTKLSTQIQQGKIWLGAPILSASVSSIPITITSDSKTSTTNSTTGTTNSSQGQSQQQNYNYTQTNKTSIIYKVQDSNQETMNQQVLIIAVVVVVGVILIALVSGYIIYKKYYKGKSVSSKPIGEINADSPGPQEDIYEPQYHPKAELGNIFGPDPTQKYKVNNADEINNDTQQDDNDNDNNNYTNPSVARESQLADDSPLQSGNNPVIKEMALEIRRRSLMVNDDLSDI